MYKKFTGSLYILGLIIGLVILAFIGVNLFDETLNPKITTLLNKPTPHPFKSENAYYSLLGLHSSDKVTPYEAGLLLEKKYHELSGDPLDKPSIDIKSYKQIGYTPFVKGTKENCDVSSNENCLNDYRKRKSDYEKSISLNKLLLSRYLQLHNYTSFYEAGDDSVLQWIHGLFNIQRLFHAQTALTWIYRNKKDALSTLNKDILFWRMVLSSDSGIIGKMISIAMLEKDIQLLSRFISDCGDCSIYQNEIDKALEKLSEDELSMRPAFEREFLLMDSTLINVLKNKKFTFGHIVAYKAYSVLYQVNSSRNEIFSFYDTVLKYAEDKNNSVFDMYQKIKEFEKDKNYDELNILDLFYNPIGKILTTIAIPSSGKYIVAPYKIQALTVLVKIKQKILKQGIKKDQIVTYLENLPVQLKNPLSSEPPKYSESDNEIYYDFIDDGRVSIKL